MPNEIAKSVRHLWLLCTPKPMAERVDLAGRTVVVTGASPNSLGYETAKTLASWGADVIATSLHDTKATEVCLKSDLSGVGADGNISVRSLDLCDTNSVSNFAEWFVKEYDGTLHVLLNNAGIHKNIFSPRQKPPLSADGVEIHWRTNYLGPFHLTNLLLPSLKSGARKSGDARVINVASHLHNRVSNEELINPTKTYHSWNAYGASKLALIHFSFELNRRFEKEFNLRSVALHPGSVHTNLTQTQSINGRIGAVLNRVNYAMTSLVLLHRKHGAQTLIMCASTPTLQGGHYYERCRVKNQATRLGRHLPQKHYGASPKPGFIVSPNCKFMGFREYTIQTDPVEVNASNELVWRVLTNKQEYGEWNPFTSRIQTDFKIGSPVHLLVRMGPAKFRITEVLCAFDKPRLIAWEKKFGARWLLFAKREQHIEPIDDSNCCYCNIDILTGLLAPIVYLCFGNYIRRGFRDVARGLKAFVESQVGK